MVSEVKNALKLLFLEKARHYFGGRHYRKATITSPCPQYTDYVLWAPGAGPPHVCAVTVIFIR
jgi:hypothetical protein